MNCSRVERLLTEDINAATKADVSRHLDRCERCAELCRQLRALSDLSKELKDEVSVPAFFTARVCARASDAPKVRRSLRFAVLSVPLVLVSFGILRFVLHEHRPITPAGEPGLPLVVEDEPSVTEDYSEAGWLVAQPLARGATEEAGRYVDILVSPPSDPSDSDYIVRLPSDIKVRNTQAENELYLRNVSH